MMTFIISSLQ